jgi:ribonuclease D
VAFRFTAMGLLLLTQDSNEDEVVLPLRAVSLADVYYVDTEAELLGALSNLQSGTGPLAIDAERASGFRYGNKAYLIQLHRENADVFLIDPIPLFESSVWKSLVEFCNEQTWILHAATQDLGCLAEIELRPSGLIDTELGSRLLGLPRVGLGAACEQLLGFKLAKEHSAADWSIRPLPDAWLNYAALDVDVLPDLAKVLMAELEKAGKSVLAAQEFTHLLSFKPKFHGPDRWRSMTGLHAVKDQHKLAAARDLWIAREELAEKLDVSPGRLVPDSSLVALADSGITAKPQMATLKTFIGRASRTYLDIWWDAYHGGLQSTDLPPSRLPASGIPNHRSWPNRFPEADARLQILKPVVAEIAGELELPVENLLQPDLLRNVAWLPAEDIAVQLRDLGARLWQIDAVASRLSDALAAQPNADPAS